MANTSQAKRRKKTLGSYPYFTVVFSITLSLFVIGLFTLLFLHADKLSRVIKENMELHIYMKRDLSQEQVDSVKHILASSPFVYTKNNTPSIVYISKDEAAKKFIEDTGEDFSLVLSENPLRESFIVKVNPAYFEEKRIEQIADQIRHIKGVFEVDYPVNLVTEINKNVKLVSFFLIGFAVILMFTTVLLINNTIKLALYSQRFLIRSMQLVGATSGFIQKPFLWRATVQGFFSGLIAAGLLGGMLQYAYSKVQELSLLRELNSIFLVLGGLVILGIFIGLLSSYKAVNKYIKMSLDELY